VRALALPAEEAEELDWLRVGGAEPVRDAGVELGCFAGREHQVVLAEDDPQPAAQDVEPLVALVGLVTGAVASLEITGGRLAGVRLADGTVASREALAVSPRAAVRAGFLAAPGLRPAEHPSGAGEHIPADPAGRTAVPGIWAAGNITDPMAQVGTAAAEGATAAAMINADLVAEETQQAVQARRDPFSAESRGEGLRAGDGQPPPRLVSVPQTGERAWAVRPGRAVGGGFFWVTRTPGLAL
jgi:hypothetical protein